MTQSNTLRSTKRTSDSHGKKCYEQERPGELSPVRGRAGGWLCPQGDRALVRRPGETRAVPLDRRGSGALRASEVAPLEGGALPILLVPVLRVVPDRLQRDDRPRPGKTDGAPDDGRR